MKITVKKIIWRAAQGGAIAVIFYFISRQITANWGQIAACQWRIEPIFLVASTVSVMITFFLFSWVWRIIVLSLGKNVSPLRAYKISYLANLGRYIPGKIWQMFGVIYLARKEGVTEEEAVTSFGLSQLFAIPSGLLSGLFFMSLYFDVWWGDNHVPGLSRGLVLVAAVVFLMSLAVVFIPGAIGGLLNRFLRLVRRRPVSFLMNKSLAAAIYGGYFLAWSMYGFSFWLFLKSIMAQEVPIIPMAGVFIIAYQVGYLMLFAPGGVGPREAVMGLFLAPFFGAGVAGAIAVAARLWLIAAEGISALIALTIKSSEKADGKDRAD